MEDVEYVRMLSEIPGGGDVCKHWPLWLAPSPARTARLTSHDTVYHTSSDYKAIHIILQDSVLGDSMFELIPVYFMNENTIF